MTRFAQWPAWWARLILLAIAALVFLAAWPAAKLAVLAPLSTTATASNAIGDDRGLYRAIAERVAAGENYYAAAAAEQRGHHYPMRPPQVFREPTEAWLLAVLPNDLIRWGAIIVLAMGVALALRQALDQVDMPAPLRLVAVLLMATGIANAGTPQAPYLHEIWAALFIALSLALRRPDRWAASVAAGFIACLFRELAAPYLVVMLTFATLERRWREVAGWLAACILFAGLFAVHLTLAAGQARPGDPASPGWIQLGGWPFVLETARRNVLLVICPRWLVAVAVCFSLAGLVDRRDPWISRVALTVGGYLAAFTVVGRPDNEYWGILYAPLLPLGLVFAPTALRDLFRRAIFPITSLPSSDRP